MAELVVLVDSRNKQIGLADKNSVHTRNTLLHRGFSLFLINGKQEILLTQRAYNKKTFPDVWTNTVCGHPLPGETAEKAAVRRLKEELGITVLAVQAVDSNYRYRFADRNGIIENEICPIFFVRCDAYPEPNPEEVSNWKWVLWSAFLDEIGDFPEKYSPWCIEEAEIVDRFLKKEKIYR